MSQRVFVKVVGFTDVERHALNTVFRLSEEHDTAYSLWMPYAPEAPKLALVDGQSYEGGMDLVQPQDHLKMIWVGDDAPPEAWRVFARPLNWPRIVQAMDELDGPAAELDFDLDVDTEPPEIEAAAGVDIDFDLDLDIGADAPDAAPDAPQDERDAQDTQPADAGALAKRALIVATSREDRLYLRARLSLADLTQADDAVSGAEALELIRANGYAVALVDAALNDVETWEFARQLMQGKNPVATVVVVKEGRGLIDQVRGWRAGVAACLSKPPDPEKLEELLKKV